MKKTYKELEFNSIIAKISSFIGNDFAKKVFIEENESITNSLSIEEVRKRFSFFTELKELVLSGQINPPYYQDIIEELQLLKRGEILNEKSSFGIYRNLKNIEKIKNIQFSTETFKLVCEFIESFSQFPDLIKIIEKIIDVNSGNIRPDASSLLKKLFISLNMIENRIRERLTKIISKYKDDEVVQDDVPLYREGRYLIGVKAGKNNIIEGIVHGRSTSKNTFFIEPSSVVRINNEKKEIEIKIEEEIKRIFFELTQKILPQLDKLLINQRKLVDFDIYYGLTKFFIKFNCNEVEIPQEKKALKIVSAYHPLLNIKPVPITFELTYPKTTAIISGPNAAGKTVSLKLIGLCVLMVKKGFLPPADKNSVIPLFDKVFSLIGDNQSMERNLSSFSSHILRIKEILEFSDNNSLVLIDEIGEGTDPSQGAALSRAVIESLNEKNVISILTTHFHELKTLAYESDKIENYSVSFDVSKMTPKFNILKGIPGKSYAFLIAKKVGISEEIIYKATNYVKKVELQSDDLFTKMEYHKNILENELQLANESRMKLEDKLRKKNQEIVKVKEELSNRKNEIIKDFRKYIEDIKGEISEKLRKIRKNPEKSLSKLQNTINNYSKEIDKNHFSSSVEEIPKKSVNKDKLAVGTYVKCFNGIKGEIISITGKKVKLDSNGMSWTVKKKDIEYILNVKKINSFKTSDHYSIPKIKNEVSLLGLNVDEAIHKLSTYLSSAMLSDYNFVYIVHGKGTGKLRTAVNEYLKTFEGIKGYRLGGVGEGGTGVTVVEL